MADAVLPHVVSRVLPGVDVLFLDTGYHFAETMGTRDAVAATMDVTVDRRGPELSVAEQDERYGPDLWSRDPAACCRLRKVEPLARALSGYEAWATGVRREDAPTRTHTPLIGWDATHEIVKINPLAAWSMEELTGYADQHGVLINPLLYDGYPSIGCAPCTARVKARRRPPFRPLGRIHQDRMRNPPMSITLTHTQPAPAPLPWPCSGAGPRTGRSRRPFQGLRSH